MSKFGVQKGWFREWILEILLVVITRTKPFPEHKCACGSSVNLFHLDYQLMV